MGKAESFVEGYLFDGVKKLRGMCLKFTSSIGGVPDRIVILNGQTIFVETKAGGEKPRPLQLKRFRDMRAAGADVRVIDTREQVDALVAEMLGGHEPDENLVAPLGLYHAYRADIEKSDDLRLADSAEELVQALAGLAGVELASANHDPEPAPGKVFQLMGRGSA